MRATDSGGLSVEAPLTIFVSDVNEPPTGILLSTDAIDENTDTTTPVTIGSLTTVDDDGGDSHDFALVAGSGDKDNSSFLIVGEQLQVQAGVLLDHETQANYSIRVRATDLGGLSSERVLEIMVNDVNEPPDARDDSAVTDEDSVLAINVLANDQTIDSGDVLTVLDFDTVSVRGATITRGSDGNLIYDPSEVAAFQMLNGPGNILPAETLVDRFLYSVDDGQGQQQTATVQVTVTGVRDWVNHDQNVDINANGSVEPLDALIIINTLNEDGSRALPGVSGEPVAYYDSNADNFVSAIDALIVINFINNPPDGPEGEAGFSATQADEDLGQGDTAGVNAGVSGSHQRLWASWSKAEDESKSQVPLALPVQGDESADPDRHIRQASTRAVPQELDQDLESIIDEMVIGLVSQNLIADQPGPLTNL